MNDYPQITDEEFRIIEQYLQRSMPDEKFYAFEEKLRQDEELRRKVAVVKLQITGIGEAALSARLPEYHKEISKPDNHNRQTPVHEINFKILLVAASVTLLLVLSVLFFLLPDRGQKLYAEYYQPDPGLMSAMGLSGNYDFDHAMIDYRTGKYNDAIQSWKKLPASGNENDTLNYFLGSAFLAKKQADSAVHYFNKVLPVLNSDFLSDTYWYLGLISLNKKNYREALEFLEKTKHENARVLIERLKHK